MTEVLLGLAVPEPKARNTPTAEKFVSQARCARRFSQLKHSYDRRSEILSTRAGWVGDLSGSQLCRSVSSPLAQRRLRPRRPLLCRPCRGGRGHSLRGVLVVHVPPGALPDIRDFEKVGLQPTAAFSVPCYGKQGVRPRGLGRSHGSNGGGARYHQKGVAAHGSTSHAANHGKKC